MNKPHILILEDDKSTAHLMQLIFDEEQFKTIIAHSNEEAIAAVKGDEIKLALVDYQLENDTADKFIKFVQQNKADMPIVLTTARMQAESVAQTLNIKNLIKKPFQIDDLVGQVRSLLKQVH